MSTGAILAVAFDCVLLIINGILFSEMMHIRYKQKDMQKQLNDMPRFGKPIDYSKKHKP